MCEATPFHSETSFEISLGQPVVPPPTRNQRKAEHTKVMLPARLTWKDQRGSTRFASVILRISEFGVYVESQSPTSISRFRLVHFQLERDVRGVAGLPRSVRRGRLLAAVYRVRADPHRRPPRGLRFA